LIIQIQLNENIKNGIPAAVAFILKAWDHTSIQRPDNMWQLPFSNQS